MEISKELAQSIVVEMKKIIEKDLNFINSEGKIIASTNETRIDTYHEGGRQAILKNDVVKITVDGEYEGARKGVNLPLKFKNELIGVIGISGETKEVEKYGQIIKRMSEILIREAYLLRKNEEEYEKEKILLETLLFQNNSIYNPIIFSDSLEELEKRKNGVIISGKIVERHNLDLFKNIFYELREKVKKYQGYAMINQNIFIILLFTKKKDEILEILNKFIVRKYLYFGVGEIKEKIGDLEKSYLESIEALEWGTSKEKNITFYDELDLELIIKNIDQELAKIYVKKILKLLTKEEIEELREIQKLYEEYNGALHKIAKELFIHVNTLQYKLNKIQEKLGLDMRNYQEFCKLKIALMLE